MAAQPNFLVLMVDQMSGMLLQPGLIEKLHIPTIKKLMARGVSFEQAYCASPLCTPARGSFMTGQLPSRNGIYDNAAEFKASTPSFAHYLRDLGYQTALSGKMHFVGPDQLHGFERRLTTDIYPADFGWTPDWRAPLERIDWWYHNLSSVTEAGVAEISNQLEFDDQTAFHAKAMLYQYARRQDTRPFCLTVSFTHPHDPYLTRQQYWDLYQHDDIPMPQVARMDYVQQDPHSKRLYDAVDYQKFALSEADVRNARHAYFANISYLDEKMGELLQVLEDCDFADNTTVVLCSDHGDMLGERGLWYKMSFFEYAMRVPFVISPADGAARTVDAPVASQDILPTLVELAGGDPEQLACAIDGASVVPLMHGEQQPERAVMAEYCAEGSVAPMVMIRRGGYKYCACEADPEQLYNLTSDPHELNNVAADPAHAQALAELRELAAQRWDLPRFKAEVLHSQACRHLVARANRKGVFSPWDYQPVGRDDDRFMRNHMDLNVVESNNRYPKKAQ